MILANFAFNLEEILESTPIKNIIITDIGDMLGGFKGAVVNFAVRNIKKMVGRDHYTNMQAAVKYATLEKLFISEGFRLVKAYYFGKTLIVNNRYLSSLRLDIYLKDKA